MLELSTVETPELISELKTRGYRVAKQDRIRVAGTEFAVSAHELALIGKNHGYMDHIYETLGSKLGVFLIKSGAVPVGERIGGIDTRFFRAEITVIVQNPEFDFPYPLTMNR